MADGYFTVGAGHSFRACCSDPRGKSTGGKSARSKAAGEIAVGQHFVVGQSHVSCIIWSDLRDRGDCVCNPMRNDNLAFFMNTGMSMSMIASMGRCGDARGECRDTGEKD